ncbi:hypothetical protein [Priestia megaterium]|uniref:hypothetical protein n=1 Tax=Priestia megaterium TaxID=1404 RepID=UPI001866A8FB|nr:hypothetical protein [Priestia megaterium]MBE2978950.1 hypothetical protein [Priestia megaterium]
MSTVKSYLDEKSYNLNDDKELLRAMADVKVNMDANQNEIAEAIGITARTLRNKITKDRAYYNSCIEEFSSTDVQEQTELSEDEMSTFVTNMIRLGTNPKSAKDMQLFIEFFEISKQDVKSILEVKKSSFRRWYKDASLDYMDRREIATVLESMSDVMYMGNKETQGATQNFVDMDIEDDLTKLQLMYSGLLFMSLFNQVEHPALPYLGQVLRLEQIKQGKYKELNKKNIKELAQFKSPKTVWSETSKLLFQKDMGWTDEQLEDFLNAPSKQAKVELPDKEQVKIDKEKHADKFNVFLTAQEEIENMIKGDK